MIIDDSTPIDATLHPGMSRGYVPRDYSQYPADMFAPPTDIPLIPRSEWDARIDEQEATQSSLEHVWRRTGEPPLDQNGKGYCWAHSTTSAVMLDRMKANQPRVRLSAFAVACKIKNFRDEGAWCGLSAQFARETGIPSVAAWPEKSMERGNDNAATWADAARHKITLDWVDLTRQPYDQNLTFDQLATCLLQGIPCPVDFNWWSHSVCAVRLVRVEAGSYGIRILNSWTAQWGDGGFATLRGNKATPDGALAVRATTPT